MAELADAHASEACVRKDIEVQLLFPAHFSGQVDMYWRGG